MRTEPGPAFARAEPLFKPVSKRRGAEERADVRLGRERQVEVRGVVLPFFGLRWVVDAEAEAPGDALDAVRHAREKTNTNATSQ